MEEPTIALQPQQADMGQAPSEPEILDGEPEVLLPPSDPKPASNPQAPVNAKDEADRRRLIRHIKTLIANPAFEKETAIIGELNIAELTSEEIQERIYEIEDLVNAGDGFSLVNNIIANGFQALEVKAATDKSFPLRIQGLTKKLDLQNPYSAFNRNLALVAAKSTSGYRISPAMNLGIQTLGAIATLHYENSAIEYHQSLLIAPAKESAKNAIDNLPE